MVRRGARGDGAGRVRAPAGRLCVLFQIGDQLVASLEQFLFVDDGVAVEDHPAFVPCPSRIRCQAATGSWTKSRQWETQRTLFSSARATIWPPAKVDGVWPFNNAWLRTSL